VKATSTARQKAQGIGPQLTWNGFSNRAGLSSTLIFVMLTHAIGIDLRARK
jgi:hypothetical protein